MAKRLALLILALGVTLFGILPTPHAKAADPAAITLYQPIYNDNGAPADGVSTIRMYVMAFVPRCNGTYTTEKVCPDGKEPTRFYDNSPQRINLYASDSSVRLQGPLQVADDGSYYGMTGFDASFDFKVTATTPGAKTITASFGGKDDVQHLLSTHVVSIRFSAVQHDDTQTTTGTGNTQTATVPGAPVAPTLNEVRVDDKTLDFKSGDTLTVKYGKSIEIKGTTIPKGTVNLFIHSNPREASVVADSKGAWSYIVDGLEEGDHTITATVFDSATQKTSAKQTLLTFTVSKNATQAAVTTKQSTTHTTKAHSTPWLAMAIGAVILALGAVGFFWIRKRRHHKLPVASEALPTTEEDAKQSDIEDTKE